MLKKLFGYQKNCGAYSAGCPFKTAREYSENPDLCLVILSNLETAILSSYQCIPWATETLCTLNSQQIAYATTDYNIMYGFGGIQLLKYNYSDAQWAEYVQSQGGTLSYE